jgi:hypothetical protein
MKAYWGIEVIAPLILWPSAIGGGEWSASRPGRLTHRKRAPGAHWIGGWVGFNRITQTNLKELRRLDRDSSPLPQGSRSERPSSQKTSVLPGLAASF